MISRTMPTCLMLVRLIGTLSRPHGMDGLSTLSLTLLYLLCAACANLYRRKLAVDLTPRDEDNSIWVEEGEKDEFEGPSTPAYCGN